MTHWQFSRLKNYGMFYSNGKNGKEEMALIPFNCGGWGMFLNHASGNECNCGTLRILIDGQIRVIIYTLKRVR